MLGMDSRGVTAGAAKAQASLGTLDKSVRSGLGTAVPVSAAAAGLAVGMFAVQSVKAALAFDQAFTRIGAISNASAQDIEAWRGEVMALSGETARAPAELAEALFFLSSAGLESGQVMEALEFSAKAAAVGLGSTVDVANIVASALNAYAEAGLTAAEVTDTLVAAVREGRAEPEEFAGALGRILPIASQAGVTFDQVSASLASLSNVGLDVNEATTAMRGALQSIVAPGTQASKAMASLGLTAQDLLDAISERGLFGALQLLDEAAQKSTNTQADYIGVLRDVIPNVRALTGVLGLTGQEAAKVEAIFDRVANATGSTGEAFRTTAESDAFKLQKALQDLQNAGQQVATDMLPGIANAIGGLAKVLGPLIGAADKLLFTFLAYKAVAWIPALFARMGASLAALQAGQTAVAAATARSTAVTTVFIAGQSRSAVAVNAAALAERNLAAARGATAASTTAASTASATFGGALGPIAAKIAIVAGAGMILNEAFYGMDTSFEELASTIDGALHQAFEQGQIDINQFSNAMKALQEGDFDSEALRSVTDELARRNTAQVELNQLTQDYVNAARPVIGVTKKVNQAQRDGAGVAREFSGALQLWATISGESMATVQSAVAGLREDYRTLLEEGKSDLEAWGAVSSEVLQGAAEDFDAWRLEAAGNLNFVSAEFGDIASDFHGSAEKIAGALRSSLEEQRRFADDINTILEDGTRGSKILAEQLLAMGPAGASAARTIAAASDETRSSIERSLAAGESAAANTAAGLQRTLVGTLKDIRGILEAIARKWGIDVNANTRKPKADIADLSAQLAKIERDSPYVATMGANTGSAMSTLDTLEERLADIAQKQYYANVQVTTSGGSTGFHLIEKLRSELDSLADGEWAVNIDVRAGGGRDPGRAGREFGEKFITAVRGSLDTLVSTIASVTDGLEGAELRAAEAFRDTWLEQAKAFRLQGKELEAFVSKAERGLERIQAKADAFADSIRSGFSSIDIIGGAQGLGESLKEPMVAELQGQIDAAKNALAALSEIDTTQPHDVLAAQLLIDSLEERMRELQESTIVPTAEDFATFLKAQLATAREFANALVALQGAGLDETLLANLAAQGPEALPFIQALLAGGEAVIADFNETQTAINDIAQGAMNTLVDEVFGKALGRAAEALDRAEGKLASFAVELTAFISALRVEAIANKMNELSHAVEGLIRVIDRVTGGGGGASANSTASGAAAAAAASGRASATAAGGPTAEQIGEQVAAAIARQGGFDPRVLIREEFDAAVASYVYNTGRGRSSV